MLHLTVFVESANRPEFTCLQQTRICWILPLLTRLKLTIGNIIINTWQWCLCSFYTHFIVYFLWIISNFFSIWTLYILKYFGFYELKSIHLSLAEWKLLSLWVNKSLVLLQTSSLKVEVDPLEIEPVMVQPNTFGALIPTQRHDRGHASTDIVCWKCKQTIFVNLHQRVILGILSLLNTNGKIKIHMAKMMIHTIMNPCVHLINLILFNIFY